MSKKKKKKKIPHHQSISKYNLNIVEVNTIAIEHT
jgi:hypothetical protein